MTCALNLCNMFTIGGDAMIIYRHVFYVLGIIFFIFASLMSIPALIDICLQRDSAYCFVIGSLLSSFLGGTLFFSTKSLDQDISLGIKEKILTVVLAWIMVPIISAVPLIILPTSIPLIDCIFESISALTTSGTTAIFDVRSLSEGVLLWRAIMQLAGGVGFIISCLFVFIKFRTENQISDTIQTNNLSISRMLKLILKVYFSAIFIGGFFLIGSGLSPIDAICYSISAVSSGGLTPDNNYSLSNAFHRINWTLSILMIISGLSVSFIKNFISTGLASLRDKQFLCYMFAIVSGSAIFATNLYITSADRSLLDCVEHAVLVVSSSITTSSVPIDCQTSFGNAFDSILYVLNFCGGCSGSCTGGIKIFRFMMLFALIRCYFVKLLKTNVVHIPTYANKRLGEIDSTNLLAYFSCYLLLAILFTILVSISGMEFGKSFGAVITAMNNNGPFLGMYKATSTEIVGLSSNVKIILMCSMICGRIEFISLFMLCIKAFWKK